MACAPLGLDLSVTSDPSSLCMTSPSDASLGSVRIAWRNARIANHAYRSRQVFKSEGQRVASKQTFRTFNRTARCLDIGKEYQSRLSRLRLHGRDG
jgi:hypothetical protein